MGSKAFSWKSTNTAFTAGVAVQNALNVLYLSVMRELSTTEYIASNQLREPPNLSKHLSFCSIFEVKKLFKNKMESRNHFKKRGAIEKPNE